jgi:DNA-binding transcriptional ArsR family regulator
MTYHSLSLDMMFQALADPTRRAIVERLSQGPVAVSELARPFNMSLPTIMQHIQLLESSGLVQSQKAGRVRTCRINAETLGVAEDWIAARRKLWERRLDLFGEHLASLVPETKKGRK